MRKKKTYGITITIETLNAKKPEDSDWQTFTFNVKGKIELKKMLLKYINEEVRP
jgi:hypothetical protein